MSMKILIMLCINNVHEDINNVYEDINYVLMLCINNVYEDIKNKENSILYTSTDADDIAFFNYYFLDTNIKV
jgi:hypothetical protein